jgi:hypothetical protein
MAVRLSARIRWAAVGVAFLADLARQRSLASAALLFLMLVDEVEGLIFVAVGLLLHRVDLFLSAQDTLFPAIVVVSGVVSLARNWRRTERVELPPVEAVELAILTERIGVAR